MATLAIAPGQAQVPGGPGSELELQVEGLRNAKGMIRLCLTRDARHFPDCAGDPQAIKRSAAAGPAGIVLSGLSPGRYALSLIHDENGNGKLDTLLGMPKEGFGFSRNPAIGFGPPKFADVLSDVGPGHSRWNIRVRYIL
ncbi:MAG: DUF2141 domain-containing protein [Pseudomonadota bacterium]